MSGIQTVFPIEENSLWDQSFRVLLTPLTYIHVGEDQARACHSGEVYGPSTCAMIWVIMIKLNNILSAWQTDTFPTALKNELESISARLLPLQAGLQQGSYVAEDEGFKVMLINAQDNDEQIQVKIGVFYASIIAGCACADDPTPINTCNEYCELRIVIDKMTAEADISLIND